MVPTDHDGILPPPAGAQNMFATSPNDIFGDPSDAVRLFEVVPNYATPLSSTFTERGIPARRSGFTSANPSGRADIEQPPPAANPAYNLDSLGDR